MLQLLQNYSIEDILIFIVILACALRGAVTFFEWALDEIKGLFDKEYAKKTEKMNVKEEIRKLCEIQESQHEDIKKITKSVDLLIRSDKDDIKAWITEKHHYFCYEVKGIDDYSLDCIEKRYGHYVEENGNSFVEDLMYDLRKLPKISTLKK